MRTRRSASIDAAAHFVCEIAVSLPWSGSRVQLGGRRHIGRGAMLDEIIDVLSDPLRRGTYRRWVEHDVV